MMFPQIIRLTGDMEMGTCMYNLGTVPMAPRCPENASAHLEDTATAKVQEPHEEQAGSAEGCAPQPKNA